jgi:hypothetical protein
MSTSLLIPGVVTITSSVIQGLGQVRILTLSTVVVFNINTTTVRRLVLSPPY